MMNRYKQLLTYIRSAVTRNYSEKSINSILDYISTSKQVWIDDAVSWTFSVLEICSARYFKSCVVLKTLFLCFQMDLLQEFYETTLEALKDAKNDRLWFKTNTKVHWGSSLIQVVLCHNLLVQPDLRNAVLCYLPAVREAVLGERRVWEIAEDPSATSPVMSGSKVFFFFFVRSVNVITRFLSLVKEIGFTWQIYFCLLTYQLLVKYENDIILDL